MPPTASGQAQAHFGRVAEQNRFSGISDRTGAIYKVWNDGYEQKIQVALGEDGVYSPFLYTHDHRGAHTEEKKYTAGQNVVVHSVGGDHRTASVKGWAETKTLHAPDHRHPQKHTYQYAATRWERYHDGHAHWSAKNGKAQGGAENYANGQAVALTRIGNKIKDELQKITGPWDGPAATGGNPFGGWLNKMMSQVLHKIPFADKATEMMSMMSGKGISHMTDNSMVQSAMKTISRTAGVGVQGNGSSQSGKLGAGGGGNGSIVDKATKSHSFNTPTASFAGDLNTKSEHTAEKFNIGSFSGALGGAYGHVKLAPARHGLETVRKLAGQTHEFEHPLTARFHFGINMEVLKTVAPELVSSPEAIFGDNITTPTTQESWTELAKQWQQEHLNIAGDAEAPDIERIVADLLADGPHTDTTVVFETQTIDAVDVYGTVVMALNAINDQQDQIEAMAAQQAADEVQEAADAATAAALIAAQAAQIISLQAQVAQLYGWISSGTLPIFFRGTSNLAANAGYLLGLLPMLGTGNGTCGADAIQGRFGFFYGQSNFRVNPARIFIQKIIAAKVIGSGNLNVNATVTHAMTWNPADEAQMNLSQGKLVAQSTSTLPGAVRATVGVTGVKIYFEVDVNQLGINWDDWAIGMANLAYAPSDPLHLGGAAGFNSFGYYRDGSVWFNGSQIASIDNFLPGFEIQVAVDFVNNRVWFRTGNNPPDNNWNGSSSANPATNVGGINITGVIANTLYFPAFSSGDNKVQTTARFKRTSWQHTPPAGFGSLIG